MASVPPGFSADDERRLQAAEEHVARVIGDSPHLIQSEAGVYTHRIRGGAKVATACRNARSIRGKGLVTVTASNADALVTFDPNVTSFPVRVIAIIALFAAAAFAAGWLACSRLSRTV